MGRHRALDLARRGATLLLHGRDRARLAEVAAEARAAVTGAAVRTCLADLADLDQVRSLAARVREREPRLDVLVNNAVVGGGVAPLRREVSRQGHELRFAVNCLAPCLLTRELWPLLTASVPARVVNVAHRPGARRLRRRHDGARPRGAGGVLPQQARADHVDLRPGRQDRGQRAAGSGGTVNALHPAHPMDTRGVREYGLTPAVPVEEGVRPTVRLITDPALSDVTGRYFDRFTDTAAHEQAYDAQARARLGALTRELLA